MKLNKETLKQTVKKGYVKSKTFISEHEEEIKYFTTDLAMDLAIAGIYYIIGKNIGKRKGYNAGYDAGCYVGTKNQERGINEWIDGMDTETYNTVVEYDKKRHNPRLICNKK